MPKNCAVILLGPAGSGKTTVARGLAGEGVTVIETGNLLEAEIRRQSPLADQIKPYKVAGELVPSDLVRQVISAELERSPNATVLFDGFPRSMDQVDVLRALLKDHQLELCSAIVMTLGLENSIKRLSGRRICSECGALFNIYSNPPKQEGICDKCGGKLTQRGDDREELVRRRFATFERETVPVIEYFMREYPRQTWEQPADGHQERVLEAIRGRLGSG